MGLTAIAAVTWGCYSALIGIGAGAWLHDHTLVAVAVGRRRRAWRSGSSSTGSCAFTCTRHRDVEPAGPRSDAADAGDIHAAASTAPPVTGRSRSDPAA